MRVLVIDDEPAMLENCARLLSRAGYDCHTLSDGVRARKVIVEQRPDVLLLDLRMPDTDGMSILAAALADDPSLPVVIITAHASVASAVEAMREGAFDYLAKPFSADQLLVAVDRALRHRALVEENRVLREQVSRRIGSEEFVGSSPVIVNLLEQVRKVAPTGANVLITGETGTGKELIARCMHANSERGDRPFVPVDCAAMPEGLLEAELFGYERGAFTGAIARRNGLLVEANGGTVFLDELVELHPNLQSKLLRALEQREVRRLGDSRLIALDIRILAATNRDVQGAVQSGALREDLYYRLNVVHLHVPPLRERAGDVALLTRTFLERFATSSGRAVPRLSPEVWDALERYRWPGNVRELKNVVQRLVILGEDGKITRAHLPEPVRLGGPPRSDGGAPVTYEEAQAQAFSEFRAAYLDRLLELHEGNVSRAAQAAGVSRRTLHRWLAELAELRRGAGA